MRPEPSGCPLQPFRLFVPVDVFTFIYLICFFQNHLFHRTYVFGPYECSSLIVLPSYSLGRTRLFSVTSVFRWPTDIARHGVFEFRARSVLLLGRPVTSDQTKYSSSSSSFLLFYPLFTKNAVISFAVVWCTDMSVFINCARPYLSW